MSKTNSEIYDSINKDIDELYIAFEKIIDEKPSTKTSRLNILDLAQKVRDVNKKFKYNVNKT